jgi:alpha-tubulin suppressor-like RCC1 family protein
MGFQRIATGNNFVAAVFDTGLLTVFGTNTIVKSAYLSVEDAVDVFAADDIVFAIRSNGMIVGFGSDRNNRLPVSYDIQNAKYICIGPDYVLCLCSDGTLKAWGSGKIDIPTEFLTNKIVSISNYNYQVTAILDNGQLLQWNLFNPAT